jgi:basic membrane protein A
MLFVTALLVAACGAPAAETPPEEEAAFKVALVMPGSIADEGYNAAAYEGLKAIEETYGAEVAFSEMVPLAEHEETFRDYAQEGYDIVIGHGFQFGDPVEKVAPEFPDTRFLVVNGAATGPNYASLAPQVQEASYVAGHIAARMSETGKIGAIGGFALPDVVCWLEGYRFGALAADPDIEVTIAYIDSFDDIALGKEATLAQISAGADCVMHIADAAGIGVIQACQEEGVWAIGFAFDQNELAPDIVITSATVDYAKMVVDAVGAIKDGSFEFGVTHAYGLASGAVPLADYHGLVPEDIAAEAEDIQQKIIDGEIEVPIVYEPTE